MTTRALVLGGGGVTGVAWELGMLHGLAEAGVDLTDADLVVGTSAGSVVAAQVTAGTGLAELYERQLRSTGSEVTARMRMGTMLRLAAASLGTRDAQEAGVRIGRLALAARTVPPAERRAIIASRLPGRRLARPAAAHHRGRGRHRRVRRLRPRLRGVPRRRGRGELRGARRVAAGGDRRTALPGRRDALPRQRRPGRRRRSGRRAGPDRRRPSAAPWASPPRWPPSAPGRPRPW